MRITTEEQLNELVDRIVAVLPDRSEAGIKSFLDARLTAYNKEAKVDAHLKLKTGKTYLPYPHNVKLVARLYDSIDSPDEADPYDI